MTKVCATQPPTCAPPPNSAFAALAKDPEFSKPTELKARGETQPLPHAPAHAIALPPHNPSAIPCVVAKLRRMAGHPLASVGGGTLGASACVASRMRHKGCMPLGPIEEARLAPSEVASGSAPLHATGRHKRRSSSSHNCVGAQARRHEGVRPRREQAVAQERIRATSTMRRRRAGHTCC